MLAKSKLRFHMAVEMLKWRSYKKPKLIGSGSQENEVDILKDEKPAAFLSEPAKPQEFWRRRRPRRRIQQRPDSPPLFARQESSAARTQPKNIEDPWNSVTVGAEYFTGRKLKCILGFARCPFKTKTRTVDVGCFLCCFKDKTHRFIPKEVVKKHDMHAVIRYYESKTVK